MISLLAEANYKGFKSKNQRESARAIFSQISQINAEMNYKGLNQKISRNQRQRRELFSRRLRKKIQE